MELNEEYSSIERALIDKAESARIPITGSLELLPICNMNCNMCYVRMSPEEVNQKGKLRDWTEWVSVAGQMKEAGVLFLLLTGGEPLLYPHFKELYLELKKMGMYLTINTNGTLIDEEWADFFGKYRPRRINITIYGDNNDTYAKLCHFPGGFTRVMKAIDLLKERRVPVKAAQSVTCENYHEVGHVLELAHEKEIPMSIDTYMMPATRERERAYHYSSRLEPEAAANVRVSARKKDLGESEFRAYRDRTLWEVENILPEEGPKHMNCHAGKSSFSINWQGEMRPCVIMTKPAMSVFEHDFQTAWKHLAAETEQILLNSKCSSCKLRPVCRTCVACALLEGGSYDALPEYMCRYAEATHRYLEEDAANDSAEETEEARV